MMKKIDSIEALRKEKETLQLKMKYTRSALDHSVSELRHETINTIEATIHDKLATLDLLAGGVKLVAGMISGSSKSDQKEKEQAQTYAESPIEPWYKPLVPIAINLIGTLSRHYMEQKIENNGAMENGSRERVVNGKQTILN